MILTRLILSLLLTLSIFVVFPHISFAEHQQYSQFRDISWGTNFADIPGLKLLSDNISANSSSPYNASRKYEDFKVGNAEVSSIVYHFNRELKFCGVTIEVADYNAGLNQSESTLDAVIQKYGQPSKRVSTDFDRQITYLWDNEKVSIEFVVINVREKSLTKFRPFSAKLKIKSKQYSDGNLSGL